MKVGYQYFLISGSLFVSLSFYLFFNANSSLALDMNGIPSKAIASLMCVWGIYRIFKGVKSYKATQNED